VHGLLFVFGECYHLPAQANKVGYVPSKFITLSCICLFILKLVFREQEARERDGRGSNHSQT
jgi:hypothetical protein